MIDEPPADAPPADAPPADAPPADAPPADAAPEWLADLPDELKADATLTRYKSVEDLARGHVEAHKVAKSKLSVPGEGASDEDWGKIWDALGRPESADKYEVPMPQLAVDAPDDAREALSAGYQPFRDLAYRIGLNAHQTKELGQFELDRQSAYFAKGEAELTELRGKLGRDYEPKLEAGRRIFAQIFGDDEEAAQLAQELDQKVGSARLVKASMRLAEIAGEHGIIETDDVEGLGEVKDAAAKITELQSDATWRDKFLKGDVTVVKQHERLLALAQQQAVRRSRGDRT